MSQRSQIYVRFLKHDGKKGLIANYYQWNFLERMISRARYGIETIEDLIKQQGGKIVFPYFIVKKIAKTFDANFDMLNVQVSTDIVEEWRNYGGDISFNDYVLFQPDNNDGKLLIDIREDGIKYAFLDRDTSTDNIMDAEQYLLWDNNGESWESGECKLEEDVWKVCRRNIAYIKEHATLMSKDEVIEFLDYDYMDENDKFVRQLKVFAIVDRAMELNIAESYKQDLTMDVMSADLLFHLDLEKLLNAEESVFKKEIIEIQRNIVRNDYPSKDFGSYKPAFLEKQ